MLCTQPAYSGIGGKATTSLGLIGGNIGFWYIQEQRKNDRKAIIEKHKNKYLSNISKHAVSQITDDVCNETYITCLPSKIQESIKDYIKDYSITKIDEELHYTGKDRQIAYEVITNNTTKKLPYLIPTGIATSGATIIYTYARRGGNIKRLLNPFLQK